MAKPVHSMIRVLDEKKSLDFYARAFDLEVADHLKFPDFALIYLRHPSSPFEVELTVNFDRKEPYALGDGYGHLAVVVDDIDVEHARFEREKLAPGPLRDFKHDGRTLARFFFVSDPDGYKIEGIQRGVLFNESKKQDPGGIARREVDRRSKYSRRVFLQGAATTVPVVAATTSVGVGIENAWADDASALQPATLKTLLKVARDIYPH